VVVQFTRTAVDSSQISPRADYPDRGQERQVGSGCVLVHGESAPRDMSGISPLASVRTLDRGFWLTVAVSLLHCWRIAGVISISNVRPSVKLEEILVLLEMGGAS
jgi:hypothetical protein